MTDVGSSFMVSSGLEYCILFCRWGVFTLTVNLLVSG